MRHKMCQNCCAPKTRGNFSAKNENLLMSMSFGDRAQWGNMTGWDEISQKLDSMYQEIVCWKLNLFEVPKGKAGKDFLIELDRLLGELTYKTNWKSLSLKLIHVFMPTMLQRPTPKSKPRQNSKFLKERLIWWSNGDLDSLLKHCSQIQKQLVKKHNEQIVNNHKAFCRLMLQGSWESKEGT